MLLRRRARTLACAAAPSAASDRARRRSCPHGRRSHSAGGAPSPARAPRCRRFPTNRFPRHHRRAARTGRSLVAAARDRARRRRRRTGCRSGFGRLQKRRRKNSCVISLRAAMPKQWPPSLRDLRRNRTRAQRGAQTRAPADSITASPRGSTPPWRDGSGSTVSWTVPPKRAPFRAFSTSCRVASHRPLRLRSRASPIHRPTDPPRCFSRSSFSPSPKSAACCGKPWATCTVATSRATA